MTRFAFLGSASLIFLSCAALPACGQQDETQAILAQCSDPAPHDLDSCLERARVQEETDPNPELQALVGKLIQAQVRASEPPPPNPYADPNHPPDDQGVSSYDVSPPDPPPSSDLGPLQPYQPPPDTSSEDENPPASPTDITPPDPDAAPPPSATGAPTPLTPPGSGPGH